MGDFGISEIITLIAAAASAGTGIYETRAASDTAQKQINAQEQLAQQQAQQAQQQALSQRRQALMREGPNLQTQVSGDLTPQGFKATEAALTGNPGAFQWPAAGTGQQAGLTPAIENLFPSGGVPSLTEPYPQNVV